MSSSGTPMPVAPHPRGSTLTLTVVPRSSKSGLEWQNGRQVRVRITAAPVDGAANAALLKFLSGALEVPRSRLSILAGESSRHKRLLIEGMDQAELSLRLVQAALERR